MDIEKVLDNISEEISENTAQPVEDAENFSPDAVEDLIEDVLAPSGTEQSDVDFPVVDEVEVLPTEDYDLIMPEPQEGTADENYIPAPPTPEKKPFHKQWWFWVALMAVIAVIGIASSSLSDGGSGGGSSSYVPYTNPYVSMVKNATHSTYGITYGKAFNSFFSNPHWEYFKSTDGLHVVEFTGRFSYSNQPATAKIQFIIDLDEGTFAPTFLSINDVAQNKLMLAALIKKVFESAL